ncbi:metal-nicotianamine transporter YSL7 [Populus alba x Populus x berolinensis]|nr:metal-nicotianamine transporter YSL7 [Populus alba x Populus x berolinensis]
MKELHLGWMIGFLFAVSFVGLFSIVPLRKLMILKYKLTYPSGTATAYLINSFHTPKGAKLAKKQVSVLFKYFAGSFLWAGFQWFWTAADGCGFASFPTIETKKGDWYSADEKPSSLHGIQGYRVFMAIATMLGDGLFHVIFMLSKTTMSLIINIKKKDSEVSGFSDDENSKLAKYDEKRRTEFFLKDQIPNWVAGGGYILLAIVSIIAVPHIFPQLKWYQILVAYVIAPVLAFCNAYGCGLTDWSLASNYGKFAIIIFSAWVGLPDGGIIAVLLLVV